MLLSICVPTLNRAPRVMALVSHLREVLSGYPADEIELIVSDNHSTDNTWESLTALPPAPYIKLIRRDNFITTGEEHFIKLIEESSGEFVWVLGDDDIPNLSGLKCLLSHIRADAADIYVFNHREITQDGVLLTESMIPMNQPWIDLQGRYLVHAVGFISTFSMFSNVVFRRRCMSPDTGRKILRISPIYSHVAWYVESFANMRARVVSTPLVNHRADFSSIQSYFEKYNQREKRGKYHIWTTGLIALFKYLLDQQLVTSEDLTRIYDHEFDGRRYRLMDKITHYIFLQIEAAAYDVRNRDSKSLETVSLASFKDIHDVILKIDPSLQDQLFALRVMHALTLAPEESWKREYRKQKAIFLRLHGAQIGWSMYAANLIGVHYGYAVYRSLTGYIAVAKYSNLHSIEIENVLSFLDPVELAPWVLVGGALDDLLEKLRDASPKVALLNFEHGGHATRLNVTTLDSQMWNTIYYSLTPFRWVGILLVRTRLRLLHMLNRARRKWSGANPN